MSSKLAYLSKYSNDIGIKPDTQDENGERKKSKKSKSKKKKSSSRHRSSNSNNNNNSNGTKVYDDIYDPDNDMIIDGNSNEKAATSSGWNDIDVDNVDEEDGPTVVAMDHNYDGNGHEEGRSSANNNSFKLVENKRYDSDDEEEGDNGGETSNRRSRRREKKLKRQSKSSRRHRYNSEDDDGDGDSSSSQSKVLEQHSRRRYDSDDEDVGRDRISSKRHDSDDESVANGSHSSNKHKSNQRYDSDDLEDSKKSITTNNSISSSDRVKSKRRYDSDDDSRKSSSPNTMNAHKSSSSSRKRRYDSDDDSNTSSDDGSSRKKQKREKTKAGYSAGLHNVSSFRKEHEEIRVKEKQRLKTQTGDGKNQSTVYRDNRGRKLDAAELEEAVEKAQKDKEKYKAVTNSEWNLGSVQKQERDRYIQMKNNMETSTFARSINDESLEDEKKEILRDGDPMAKYSRRSTSKTGGKQRPVYKGPQPKPNRFSIRPGYRWDGIDRGNGFEDQVLAQMFSKGRKKEEAYRYSAADM